MFEYSIQNLKSAKGAQSEIKNNPLAALILLAFVGLAVIYSLVTPPFEAGDESRHYAVVKYMADTGRLIVQNSPETAEWQHHWSHEGNQPPLYYALAAGLTGWIETGSWEEVFWYNPHTSIGDPLRPDNKNITIHPPEAGWPWRGHVLAVHLIRFLSIAMATVTGLAAYAIALSLFRGNRLLAAGALALTAFNPMFIFISASVNNDNAVIMFVTLALWLMVRLAGRLESWKVGRDEPASAATPPHPRTPAPLLPCAALLGLLIGLGALSKLYALGLLPLAGLLLLWLAYRRAIINYQLSIINYQLLITSLRTFAFWRDLLTWSAALGLVFLGVAGWFYLRNALIYNGDLFALDVMRETAGQRQSVPSLATIRAEFEGFRIAYWALFGGVNILADPWVYKVLDGVSLVAVVGVAAFITRRAYCVGRIKNYAPRTTPPPLSTASRLPSTISLPTFTLLLLWYLIMIAGFIVWNLTQPAGQGRLMYPAIAAISALGVLGLTWWLPQSGRRAVVAMCGLGLFAFALIVPWRTIAPAYAHPPILSRAELPADLQPVDFTYDGTLRLIGYKLPVTVVRPAETLPLTLYWEVLAPPPLDYSLFIHLLGRNRAVIGQRDTYPGGGAWPATLLQPGDILADHYAVPVSPQAEFEHAPTRLRIAAGIYDLAEPGRPGKAALNAAGQPVEPIIASVKLVPWQWPDPPASDNPANFLDKVTLLDSHLTPDQGTLTLTWQVNQPLDRDYTVFIQAWRRDSGEYVAGFDGPPVQNDYPTSLWASGEVIIDAHPLDLAQLPPGDYDLLVGLYDPLSGERLPAFSAAGPLPDYAVNAGVISLPLNSSQSQN